MLNKNYSNINYSNKINSILNKKTSKSKIYNLKSDKINIESNDFIKNNKERLLSRNKTKPVIHDLDEINKTKDPVKTVILPPISNKNSVPNHETTNSMQDININIKTEVIPIKERLYGPKKCNSNFNDFVNNCNKISGFYAKKTEHSSFDMEELKKIQQLKLNGIKAAQIKAFKNSRLKDKNLWRIRYKKLKLEGYDNDEN